MAKLYRRGKEPQHVYIQSENWDEEAENKGASGSDGIELDKQMEYLRKEQREARDAEYKRISKEFTNNNYGMKYNTTLVTMLCALFGYDFMKREIDKFPSAKVDTRQHYFYRRY